MSSTRAASQLHRDRGLTIRAGADSEDFRMRSRMEIRVHINRALRAGTAEQKLDELALAIGELARYIEEIEKDRQRTSIPR